MFSKYKVVLKLSLSKYNVVLKKASIFGVSLPPFMVKTRRKPLMDANER